VPERIKQILESVPAMVTAAAAVMGGVWAAIWSRRTTKAELEKKEAEATAATSAARRQAEQLEAEAFAQGFGGLKSLVEYFQSVVKTLRTENDELRGRVADLERTVRELQSAHRTCEEETAKLRRELAGIKGAGCVVQMSALTR
jgi:chromosome segregation ATPase